MTRNGNSRSSRFCRAADAIARAIVEPQTPSSAAWTASARAHAFSRARRRTWSPAFSFSATARRANGARRSAGGGTRSVARPSQLTGRGGRDGTGSAAASASPARGRSAARAAGGACGARRIMPMEDIEARLRCPARKMALHR